MYYSMILSRCYYKSSFWVVDKLFLPIIFNCEKFKFFRQQFRVLKFNFDKNVGQKYKLVYIFLLALKLRWWGESCVFQPGNGRFTWHLLVKIGLFSVHLFIYSHFFLSKTRIKMCILRSGQAFGCLPMLKINTSLW